MAIGGQGKAGRRLRVAGGENWDALVYLLAPGESLELRNPTGSLGIVKTLLGLLEVTMVRNGEKLGAGKKELRGGGDGTSLGGGGGGSADACIKFLGGPVRGLSPLGMTASTVVLEVVVRPPTGAGNEASKAWPRLLPPTDLPTAAAFERVPEVVVAEEEEEEEEEEEAAAGEEEEEKKKEAEAPGSGDNAKAGAVGEESSPRSVREALELGFEEVGGLDDQLDAIVRRVLASRANPAAARRLGVGHVRGVLLSGPPGCGKTLLARELARTLGAREPQIVNGPEILDKFVGEAEKKVRQLFAPAEAEYAAVGDGE